MAVAVPAALGAGWIVLRARPRECVPATRSSGEVALLALLAFALTQLLRMGLRCLIPSEASFTSKLADLGALGLGAALLLVVRQRGGLLRKESTPPLRALGLGLAAYIAAFPCVLVAHWLAALMPGGEDVRRSTLLFLAGAETTQVLVVTALLMSVVPLFEELVFRGFLLRGLESMVLRVVDAPRAASWIAAVVSSACFAAVHERAAMPAIFVVGLLLSWVALRGGGLWAAMAFHALHNGITVWVHLSGATAWLDQR
jgi:membrane protease YdiL (CAAX protease family)